MNRVQKLIQTGVRCVYIIMIFIILANVLFGQNIDYSFKKDFPIHMAGYLLLGGIGIIGGYVLIMFLLGKLKKRFAWLCKIQVQRRIMAVVSGVTVLMLAVFAYHYFFVSGWDVLCVQHGARALAFNHGQIDQFYFSSCPNNLMLMCIYAKISTIGSWVGIGYVNLCCVLFQSILFAATGFLVFETIRMLFGGRTGVFAWILYMLFIGFSPWMVVPYSDGTGLIFPVLIFYIYVCLRRNKRPMLCAFLLACISCFAYNIKPQLFIIGIAITILSVVEILTKMKSEKKIGSFAKGFVAVATGLAAGIVLVSSITYIKGFELDTEANIGMLHYLKMGLNAESGGTYSIEDVQMSNSYLTRKERNNANLQEVFERIEDMGPAGLLELGQKKLLTIYSDGTFGWWVEGGFLEGDIEAGHPKLREILCSIYYPDGKYYPLFCNWVQAIWLGVLTWGLCNAWEKDVKDEVSVLILSVIGLTLFELLFEARARYLFTYGPIYVITAICGIVVVYKKIIKSAYKSE